MKFGGFVLFLKKKNLNSCFVLLSVVKCSECVRASYVKVFPKNFFVFRKVFFSIFEIRKSMNCAQELRLLI